MNLVKLDSIVCDETFNCRGVVSEAGCTELANSIEKAGMLLPFILRPLPGRQPGSPLRYQMVAGHRRYTAAKSLGWTEAEAVIRELSDREAHFVNLQENLGRKDLTPGQELAGIVAIYGTKPNPRVVAKELGKGRTWVANRLKVLQMDKRVQRDVADGMLSAFDISLLVTCPVRAQFNLAKQLKLGKAEGLSSTEVAVKAGKKRRPQTKRQIQLMMTELLEKGLEPPVWKAMAWCAGTISDEELQE